MEQHILPYTRQGSARQDVFSNFLLPVHPLGTRPNRDAPTHHHQHSAERRDGSEPLDFGENQGVQGSTEYDDPGGDAPSGPNELRVVEGLGGKKKTERGNALNLLVMGPGVPDRQSIWRDLVSKSMGPKSPAGYTGEGKDPDHDPGSSHRFQGTWGESGFRAEGEMGPIAQSETPICQNL